MEGRGRKKAESAGLKPAKARLFRHNLKIRKRLSKMVEFISKVKGLTVRSYCLK